MENIKILFTTFVGFSLLLSGCNEDTTNDTNTPPSKEDITIPVVVTPPTPVSSPYKSAGWYAKTEVAAVASDGTVYKHKTAGIFGELVQSSDEKDQHDIPGYDAALLQVIFLPSYSSDTVVGYFSEYKYFDVNSTDDKKVWTFQVKNQNTVDLSGQKITINLNGVYDVEYRDDRAKIEYLESEIIDTDKVAQLTLIDIDFQRSYSVDQIVDANLSMIDASGNPVHTRTFKWIYGTVDATDYATLAPQRASGRISTPEFTVTTTEQSFGKFGLPPK